MKESSHRITVTCPDNLVVNSYPGSLAQVITNLIINSLTHGFAGRTGGTISIMLGKTDRHWIHMEYSDDGKGMTQEQIDHLFEPFFSSMEHHEGRGLGCYIIYCLVTQRFLGTIQTSSAPHQGLKYLIDLAMEVVE